MSELVRSKEKMKKEHYNFLNIILIGSRKCSKYSAMNTPTSSPVVFFVCPKNVISTTQHMTCLNIIELCQRDVQLVLNFGLVRARLVQLVL